VDLTITTTVLRGNQTVTLDSMGQPLPQTVHAGLFQWQRGARTSETADPFGPANIELTAHQLALASRSTASFPVAFEPSFIPVSSPDFPVSAPGTRAVSATEAQRLHPDMSRVVRSWGERSGKKNRSRYVIDGGVLANTPTMSALRAVEAMKAEGPVRRVMLLVYPHAPSPDEDTPDVFGTAPTVAGTLNGLLGALSGQGSRTYVDQLEEHNRRAAGRRGTRSDILHGASPTELHALAEQIHPHYRRLRMWRAARDLASRLAGTADDGTTSSALPEGWNYDRVRSEAERAQEQWLGQHDDALPYVPAHLPTTREPSGWAWGVAGALGVAEAANELLRQLVTAMCEVDEDYEAVCTARRTTFELGASIESMRGAVDAAWATDRGDTYDAVIGSLAPNRGYWSLRLAYYDHLMAGSTGWGDVVDLIEAVAGFEGDLAGARAPDPAAEEARAERKAAVLDALTQRLASNAAKSVDQRDADVAGTGTAGAVGQQIGMLVGAVVDQVTRALDVLDSASFDVECGPFEEVRRWQLGLGLTPRPSADQLLVRLIHLEVAATTLGDEVSTGATLPVELVQLSAQTKNGFAEHSRTADDKLGGWSLNRFGGFLKRSWRANDWTWGRIDSATVLCRTVLRPSRVRRIARVTGYLDQGTPEQRAEATVAELATELFGEPGDDLQSLLAAAVKELEPVLDATVDEGELPATLPALADLFARAIHEQVVVTELPAIATAIRADAVEGGYQRSRGEVLLATEGALLERLGAASRSGPARLPAEDRSRALKTFDSAGIGREPLREESSSDMTIRTATTAAAVAATVLSSSRSGLKAISPVSRALRGLMLLPYWVVTGLTSKGGLARNLSLLGLALGGTLLALSLFGALPESLAGPATAVGASAVLVAFAYAALRTGTLLHGVVLLSPVIPLLAYSVVRARADAAAEQGSMTLVVVIGLAVALMLLGSFGTTYGSVWSTLDRLADRRGVRLVTGPMGGQAVRPRSTPAIWVEAVARSLWPLLLALVVLAGVVALVAVAVRPDWVQEMRDWSWPAWAKWGLVVLVPMVATTCGAKVADVTGKSLRVLARVPVVDADGRTQVDQSGNVQFTWQHQRLANPRGIAVGWSVLYGAVYSLLAVVLLADPFDMHQEGWYAAALVTSVLFAAILVLVAPWLLPVLEYRAISRGEQIRACMVVDPPDYAADLAHRGLGYRHFVTEGSEPTLTRFGRRLHDAVKGSRTSPR
jgi:patatin-related protein